MRKKRTSGKYKYNIYRIEKLIYDGLYLSEAKDMNINMEEHMEIQDRFAREVINDYFTANVKAEVILDTILTPVIDKIITAVCKEIKGDMKLLAKEFPILNILKGKETFRSCNADYLMCDNEFVYLVELKTTQDSYSESQMDNYIKKCGKEDIFAEKLWDFIRLLNHVSKTGISDKKTDKISNNDLESVLAEKRNEESDWEVGKDDLKWLFERIVAYAQELKTVKELWNNQTGHASRAIYYLQGEKAVSSKKYLFTAGQMLDHMTEEYGNWWNYKIKLICITPNKIKDNKKQQNSENVADKQDSANIDIIYLTFEDIINVNGRNIINKKIEEDYPDLMNYWEWTFKILCQCMVCYDQGYKERVPKA